eukprot:jgi/Tetstr1/459811/TSEL_005161.t1
MEADRYGPGPEIRSLRLTASLSLTPKPQARPGQRGADAPWPAQRGANARRPAQRGANARRPAQRGANGGCRRLLGYIFPWRCRISASPTRISAYGGKSSSLSPIKLRKKHSKKPPAVVAPTPPEVGAPAGHPGSQASRARYPGPPTRPSPAGDGVRWGAVDHLSDVDMVHMPAEMSMETAVPIDFQEAWAEAQRCVNERVVAAVEADDTVVLDRALKWKYMLPQLLLRAPMWWHQPQAG